MDKIVEKTENSLSEGEKERYLRQIIIPEIGEKGQLRLKNSSVLIIGAGGLGLPAAIYLTATGIGRIGIVDNDVINLSNLQRQIIYKEKDIGFPKTDITAEVLNELNTHTQVDTYNLRLDSSNITEIISGYDLIIDGSDNFQTKYLINDACVLTDKPFISGSVLRFEAQISFFNLPDGPCYRCLFPSSANVPDCNEAGVLGVVPGIAGTIMAAEAVKYLVGIGELLKGKLLLLDVMKMQFKEIRFSENSFCNVCSENASIKELIDLENQCINQNKIQNMQEYEISVEELKKKMDSGENFFLLDVREAHEIPIASIGGTVIPLSELMDRLNELPENKDEEIIVYCRTGNRSHHATMYLRNDAGYRNVKNLLGGIHAWHDRIDSSVKKY